MPIDKREFGRFLSRLVPLGLFPVERAHGKKTSQESIAVTQE